MNVVSARRVAGSVALVVALAFAGSARAQCFASRLFPDKPRTNDALGKHVDISGTRAILGAPGLNQTNGRAVIFERSGAQEWSEVASIESPEPDDSNFFGAAVAIDGNFVAVGAPYADVGSAANGGRVYVYRRLTLFGNPVWVLDATVNTAFPGINDRFGWAVDLATIGSTLTLAVGIPRYDEDDVFDSGRARIFTRDAEGNWSLQDTVIAHTQVEEAEFGISVDLDPSGRLVVGAHKEHPSFHTASGAAYIFTKSGSDWGAGVRVVAPEEFVDGTDYFGTDVAIWGSWVAVGAPRNSEGSVQDAGAIYLYQRLGATTFWLFSERLANPDPDQLDMLGAAIDMRAGLLVAGDPNFSDTVRLWKLNDGDWNPQFPYPLPSGSPPGAHEFGAAVALSDDGEYLLVGDISDSGSGAGYIFVTEPNPASTCAGSIFDPVILVEPGTSYIGCNDGAATDGVACITTSSDVWYRYTATCNGVLALSTCGTHDMGGQDSGIDTVLSVYSGCPGTAGNMLICNNNASTGNWPDACGLFGNLGVARDAAVKLGVTSGQSYRIRVASNGSAGPTGLFVLRVEFICCTADWDGNGVVNSTDVSAFINDWFADQVNGTLFTDFDDNGVVNSTDVSMFINAWFVGCEV